MWHNLSHADEQIKQIKKVFFLLYKLTFKHVIQSCKSSPTKATMQKINPNPYD